MNASPMRFGYGGENELIGVCVGAIGGCLHELVGQPPQFERNLGFLRPLDDAQILHDGEARIREESEGCGPIKKMEVRSVEKADVRPRKLSMQQLKPDRC